MDNPLIIFLSVLTGLAIGVVIMVIISKAGLNKDQQKASMLLKEAETKADSMVKQAVLDGRTQAHELKIAAEKEIKERKQEVTDMENKLLRREDNLNFRDETLTSKEKQIDVKSAQLADKMAMLDKKDKELQEKIDVQVEELERVASLTTAEAREELMAITEKRMEKETMAYIKEKEEEAKSIADEKARNIVALSIQRISSDEAVDRTVSVVSLPSEEMKGRIIGREGRNIKAIEQATGVDLIIDDTPGISIAEMRSKCRKYKLEHNLGIIMIDYLQLMSGSGKSDSRQQEISDISRSLKALARELSVPVIALSQLSRAVEQRPDHRPMLSDLRESGAIEQDADVVMFLYRDDYYHKDTEKKDIAEVIIAKQRNGPIGTIELVWLPRYTQFVNMKK